MVYTFGVFIAACTVAKVPRIPPPMAQWRALMLGAYALMVPPGVTPN